MTNLSAKSEVEEGGIESRRGPIPEKGRPGAGRVLVQTGGCCTWCWSNTGGPLGVRAVQTLTFTA